MHPLKGHQWGTGQKSPARRANVPPWGAFGAHWLLGFTPLTTNYWPEAPWGEGAGVVGVLGPTESRPPPGGMQACKTILL